MGRLAGGVHQVAAGAAQRDAITNHMLAAQEVIRAMGLRSEIFVDDGHIDPTLAGRVRPHHTWDAEAQPGDVAIVHYSIASAAFEHVSERTDRLALHYHNITPARYLWEFAPGIAAECALGRRRLGELTRVFGSVCADSDFNARELGELGFADPQTIGIIHPDLPIPDMPDSDRDGTRILFVGRGIPNKAQHHLILALAGLRENGMDATLRLVGSWAGVEAYEAYCRSLVERLGIEEHVELTGSVTAEQLAAEYASAALFLCLSDHEGYCVPIVEAIQADLPIVAYAAGAVPETAGRAALLLDEKPPSLVAEAVLATLDDDRLRERMAIGRSEQRAALGRDATIRRLHAFVEGLV